MDFRELLRRKIQPLLERPELRVIADGIEHPVDLDAHQARPAQALTRDEPLERRVRIAPLGVDGSIADGAEIGVQRLEFFELGCGGLDLAERVIGECQTKVPFPAVKRRRRRFTYLRCKFPAAKW